MNTPAPKTSPDAALGNLMAAALDVPAPSEPPEVPAWAPDNTPSNAPVALDAALDGTAPKDVLLSVWNAMQSAADGNDLLSRLEHMRGSIARAVSTAGDATGTLPPLNDDLIDILGRPNFMCGGLATLLRADGHDIKQKAEHEQAAAIHFLLGHYLQHGAAWRSTAGADLDAIAAQQGKGGA